MTIDWHEYFLYDENSPSCLVRKHDWIAGAHHNQIRAKAGEPAGSVGNHGYYVSRVEGKLHLCHRIIQEMFFGQLGDLDVDHIDGNKQNNKISNLRRCKTTTNCRNQRKRAGNKSGVCGVMLRSTSRPTGNSKQWVAVCRTLDGKYKSKAFSVHKWGNEKAFELACVARAEMIEELNMHGAGYTERHGI